MIYNDNFSFFENINSQFMEYESNLNMKRFIIKKRKTKIIFEL